MLCQVNHSLMLTGPGLLTSHGTPESLSYASESMAHRVIFRVFTVVKDFTTGLAYVAVLTFGFIGVVLHKVLQTIVVM